MSQELQLTRRGLIQIMTALVATAFAVRPRRARDADDDVLEAELVEDEPATSRARAGRRSSRSS
jgi:hypothetical protein